MTLPGPWEWAAGRVSSRVNEGGPCAELQAPGTALLGGNRGGQPGRCLLKEPPTPLESSF